MKDILEIGDSVRIHRTVYEIVGEFTDTREGYVKDESGKYVFGNITEHFYVGRKEKSFTSTRVRIYEYSNIIVWSEEKQNWMLRS